MITHSASQKTLAEQLEWMDSARKRSRGLLKYESAPTNFVAIFRLPFCGFFPLVHTLGMKFPIDILFCDRQKKVLSKFSNVGGGRFVLPWKYFLGGCAYLLEFSGCSLSDVGIGDRLEWKDIA